MDLSRDRCFAHQSHHSTPQGSTGLNPSRSSCAVPCWQSIEWPQEVTTKSGQSLWAQTLLPLSTERFGRRHFKKKKKEKQRCCSSWPLPNYINLCKRTHLQSADCKWMCVIVKLSLLNLKKQKNQLWLLAFYRSGKDHLHHGKHLLLC